MGWYWDPVPHLKAPCGAPIEGVMPNRGVQGGGGEMGVVPGPCDPQKCPYGTPKEGAVPTLVPCPIGGHTKGSP